MNWNDRLVSLLVEAEGDEPQTDPDRAEKERRRREEEERREKDKETLKKVLGSIIENPKRVAGKAYRGTKMLGLGLGSVVGAGLLGVGAANKYLKDNR